MLYARPVSNLEFFAIVLVAFSSVAFSAWQFHTHSQNDKTNTRRVWRMYGICAFVGGLVSLYFHEPFPLYFAIIGVPLGVAYAKGHLF